MSRSTNTFFFKFSHIPISVTPMRNPFRYHEFYKDRYEVITHKRGDETVTVAATNWKVTVFHDGRYPVIEPND